MFRVTCIAALIALYAGQLALAQDLVLPPREAPRPQTTAGIPHTQIGFAGDEALSAELSRRVAKLPGVTLGPTRVSLPGAVGFQLSADMHLERPEVIVGGLEFAHLHPDGSLHASLDPQVALAAVEAGWATAHPWADQREGWEGFVLIYSPINQTELDVVTQLVVHSYSFVTGKHEF